MARYGQAFKERAVARLLPPESAAITAVSQELGVSVSTLERWRESATTALSQPEELRASPQQTRDDRRWIKELERDLRRKNAALAETTALPVLSKNRGDLPAGRGRMISLEDRQLIAQHVEQAHRDGARLKAACALAGIDVRTLQRWKVGAGLQRGDPRP